MFNLPIPPLPIPGMGFIAPVGVPVGTVVVFAGKIESSPSNYPSNFTTNLEALGWTVCDGKELKVSEYPELFAVLGYLYGGENEIFKIPDYRGYFLRGVDGGANRDPDANRRIPAKGGTPNEVGSQQEDALQLHEHQYNKVEVNPTFLQPEKGVPAIAPLPSPIGRTDEPTNLQNPVRTSSETRPKNVAVNYIIKFINA
ncbi:MAG: phage tail protein [Oscillatoriaceae cyanobacterium Prado104]|jgi:microcystin-dependent protein|nr:phage tail protein [Oscillatoriaceae cyanobacterium Prado104]